MSRIDCTTEEKIHELLVYLKKEKPEIYVDAKRVLKYLYKTVKEDYFDRILSLEQKKDNECESHVKKVNAAKRKLYNDYIDDEDAILDNFIKLCHDDSKYFTIFFDEIDPYLEMFEEHLYSNYEIFNYVFNIYVMLKGYELSKGDLPFFSKIVKDYANLLITSKLDLSGSYSSYGPSDQEFSTKLDIIDSLLELKTMSNIPYIDIILKEVLDEINYSYGTDLKRKISKVIEDYGKLYEHLQSGIQGLNKETITKVEESLNKSLEDYKKSQSRYRSSSYDTLSYFSTIVLFGNRYDYLTTTLEEIEPSTRFKKDILTRIEKWDYKLFEFLNKEISEEQDSFITCMTMVFDSDTYYELIGKMDCINNASKVFEKDPKQALQLINTLNTNEYVEEINGVKMMWPKSNSINKPNKPKTIIERTKKLHRAVKYAPAERYYDDRPNSPYYSENIASFVKTTKEEFKKNEKESLDAIKKQQEIEQQPQEPPKKVKGLGGLFKKGN